MAERELSVAAVRPPLLDDRHSRQRVLQSSLQAIERLAKEVGGPDTTYHLPTSAGYPSSICDSCRMYTEA